MADGTVMSCENHHCKKHQWWRDSSHNSWCFDSNRVTKRCCDDSSQVFTEWLDSSNNEWFKSESFLQILRTSCRQTQLVWTRDGSREGDRPPPKTYESNFFHHDFEQFRKQHSRYRDILASIVLSQQCREVGYTSSVLQ